MSTRLVRRRPLVDRIKAYFNPLDFLLWLSEELESSDWDQWQNDWGVPIGIGLNFAMLIARGSRGSSDLGGADDVFSDNRGGPGWIEWLAAFIAHLLLLLSIVNAAYTFYRKRHYRLFEASIDASPSTPSAHRVRVDSSPLSSSPLRFLSNILTTSAAGARSHQDVRRDVWELSVWDPTPICLRIFCLFSPLHILIYWLFLPTTLQDPRPTVTVVTMVALAALLSVQLTLLQSNFLQQSKDKSVIHKEVLNEYDTKFVHPRTQPQMRDVGTQFSSRSFSHGGADLTYENEANTVVTYTPTTIINRGFHTRPNPNYVNHIDPEGYAEQSNASWGIASGVTPTYQTPAYLLSGSSLAQSHTAMRQPLFTAKTVAKDSDGGSLGVYSHASSPLRRSASTNFDDGHRLHVRSVSPIKRGGSPLKRTSVLGV